MLVALFAATLTIGGGQAVSVIATTPPPAEARREGQSDTRRVCQFERATGSNFQQRVCRDVSRQSVQDQQTREFMRANQRMRLPDEPGGGGPIGPNS
ncbi:hypothetical protein [Brevundimonas sp. GCM10030266]|uniref:hypothetical protein n=1 Tax=Brevundimonas sp. GCM10030266 TaxID=3273386 RepID=UPI00361925F2